MKEKIQFQPRNNAFILSSYFSLIAVTAAPDGYQENISNEHDPCSSHSQVRDIETLFFIGKNEAGKPFSFVVNLHSIASAEPLNNLLDE